MHLKKHLPVFIISYMLFLSSCIVGKKVIYVNDMLPDTNYRVTQAPALLLQKGDRLGITVSAKNPELAIPFNQNGSSYQLSDRGDVSAKTSAAAADTRGYLVNENGEIEFPILGTLKIAGLSLNETKEMIRKRLVGDKLINDPIITVELLNLKINLIGEVKTVGVLNVPDGRITLLEAISRAGGLTINAATDKIAVIREEHGERKIIMNNIQSKDIFDSPAYYLQQNDIVYVASENAQVTPREQNNWRYISTGLGLLATVFTIINLFK